MIKSTLKRMLGLLAPYKKLFFWGQVAMLIGTAAGLAFPAIVGHVFATLEQGDTSLLLGAVGLLAGVAVVGQVANYGKNNALQYIGLKIIRDLRAQVYDKLLELSLDFYASKNSGEITSNMSNDMMLLQQGVATGLTIIVQQVISLVVVIILLLRIDPLLTLAVFCTLPVIILVSRRMGARVKAISRQTQERLGELMGIISQSISGISIIQAFVLEHYARGMFRNHNDQVVDRAAEGIRVSSRANLVVGLLNYVFLLVTIGLGAYRVASGVLTTPMLISFILYSEMVAGPISMLAGLYVEVNKAVAAFQRISDILDAQVHVAQVEDPLSPDMVQGHIRFEQVKFGYDQGRPVLQDIDLEIKPGETVALVGPSGAGKSTLVKLLPRFYDPDAGRILLDGVDVAQMDLQALRSHIAIVPQETHLFGLSIATNIAFGNPDATEEAIVAAAKLANAHAFILEQERGYDTEVGENGARLSGGQRQRIAIARAFLKDPRILILDEATSALDTYSESKVQMALETLMQGRTTLIIAHRLSTIENADRIVVIQDGRVLAQGPHAELYASCALYHDLYARQFALQDA